MVLWNFFFSLWVSPQRAPEGGPELAQPHRLPGRAGSGAVALAPAGCWLAGFSLGFRLDFGLDSASGFGLIWLRLDFGWISASFGFGWIWLDSTWILAGFGLDFARSLAFTMIFTNSSLSWALIALQEVPRRSWEVSYPRKIMKIKEIHGNP